MRELLVEVLEDRGYQVSAAGGGEEALSLARSEHFDLIIADIRMEGMTGLDAIERAKEHQPDLGSIVISGYASEQETLRAVRLNVGAYLKKPFKMQDLLAQINDFAAQRVLERRRFQEVHGLRSALFWSLDHLGRVADRLHEEKVASAADLAANLGSHCGMSTEEQRELRAAAIINQLFHLRELEVPDDIIEGLTLSTLRAALESLDSPNSDLAAFASLACRELSADEHSPEALERFPELEQRIREAYLSWVAGEKQSAPQRQAVNYSGLLGLAGALERTGDFSGAKKIYGEILEQASTSHLAVAGWLGAARVASGQGNRKDLEQAVRRLLIEAEQLGPVTSATAQLEAAEILHRSEHPAAEKLLIRAVESLKTVRLEVPRVRAILKLANRTRKVPASWLSEALEVLANPIYRSELFESLSHILPDLIEVSLAQSLDEGARLASLFIKDHPQEVAILLRQGRLGLGTRTFLLGVYESDDSSVPSEVLQLLVQDVDPELRVRALRLKEGTSAPPVLRVTSLGSLEVYFDDERIEESSWKSLKVKHLFFYLAYKWGRPTLVETAMDMFWPGPGESARKNLNSAVSSIRRCFRRGDSESWDPVPREKDVLHLNPQVVLWHDLEELNKAYREGREALHSGRPDQAVTHFRRVARLYGGPYLEGCYMDWALAVRTQVERQVSTALEHLVEHSLDNERFQEALEYSVSLLQLNPDQQEAHHAKMRAHLGLGQPELTVKQYEACALLLDREYGVEPNIDLLRTFHQARYGLGDAPSQLIG